MLALAALSVNTDVADGYPSFPTVKTSMKVGYPGEFKVLWKKKALGLIY